MGFRYFPMTSTPFIRSLTTETTVKIPLRYPIDYKESIKPNIYNNILFLTIDRVRCMGYAKTEYSIQGAYLEVPVKLTGYAIEITPNVVYRAQISKIAHYIGLIVEREDANKVVGIKVHIKNATIATLDGVLVGRTEKNIYRTLDMVSFVYTGEPYTFSEGMNTVQVALVE